MIRIGLISDTHALLRPQAIAALRGCDRIVHAGDIGSPEILAALMRIAPVTAVRGNNDRGAWANRVPETDELHAGAAHILVVHDRNALGVDPAAAGYNVVVAGHSHRPGCEWQGSVLHINPGSAGPRRFTLPVSMGYLFVDDAVRPELIELQT